TERVVDVLGRVVLGVGDLQRMAEILVRRDRARALRLADRRILLDQTADAVVVVADPVDALPGDIGERGLLGLAGRKIPHLLARAGAAAKRRVAADRASEVIEERILLPAARVLRVHEVRRVLREAAAALAVRDVRRARRAGLLRQPAERVVVEARREAIGTGDRGPQAEQVVPAEGRRKVQARAVDGDRGRQLPGTVIADGRRARGRRRRDAVLADCGDIAILVVAVARLELLRRDRIRQIRE